MPATLREHRTILGNVTGFPLHVRRNRHGTSFKEVEDTGRLLAADRRRKAKTVARRGQGDRGDRRR